MYKSVFVLSQSSKRAILDLEKMQRSRPYLSCFPPLVPWLSFGVFVVVVAVSRVELFGVHSLSENPRNCSVGHMTSTTLPQCGSRLPRDRATDWMLKVWAARTRAKLIIIMTWRLLPLRALCSSKIVDDHFFWQPPGARFSMPFRKGYLGMSSDLNSRLCALINFTPSLAIWPQNGTGREDLYNFLMVVRQRLRRLVHHCHPRQRGTWSAPTINSWKHMREHWKPVIRN